MSTTTPTCPRCAGEHIQAVAVPRKSVSKALLAELAVGTAAGLAASSSTIVMNACLRCGAQWVPGSLEERGMRMESGQFGEEARQRWVKIQEESKGYANRVVGIGCLVLLAVFILIWIIASIPDR
jgi:hypothetical protein